MAQFLMDFVGQIFQLFFKKIVKSCFVRRMIQPIRPRLVEKAAPEHQHEKILRPNPNL